MRTRVYFLISYMLIWAAISGFFENGQNLHYLIIAAILTITFSLWLKILPNRNMFNVNAIFYCGYLLREILISAWSVSKIAWRKQIILQADLVPIKFIQNTNIGTVVYANSITLTPGTVTLSVDKEHLLVHSLDSDFINSLQAGDMDTRVKEIIK